MRSWSCSVFTTPILCRSHTRGHLEKTHRDLGNYRHRSRRWARPWRLTPIAIEPIQANQLGTFHWFVMIAWILINAYAEGYRGFHKRYSPRTVARAFYLVDNPTPLRVIFAPLFCMGPLELPVESSSAPMWSSF